jgi:hypothetical protein
VTFKTGTSAAPSLPVSSVLVLSRHSSPARGIYYFHHGASICFCARQWSPPARTSAIDEGVDGLGSFGNARHWVKLLSNVLMKLRVEWDGLVTQAITATEIGNKTHVVVEVLEHVLQLGWACALDLPAIMAMPLVHQI